MFYDKKVLTNIKQCFIFDLSINIKYLTKGNFQMKETAIKKINKVGHISLIITKIARILLIIGLVGAIIGEVALWFLPNDLFKVQVGGETTVVVSKQAILKFTPSETDADVIKEIDDYIKSGTLKVDGDEYAFADFSVDNDSIIMNGGVQAPAIITISNIRGAVGVAIAVITCSLILFKFLSALCKALSVCETPFDEVVSDKLTRFAYALLVYVVVKGVLTGIISSLFAGAVSIDFNIDLSAILLGLGIYGLTVIFKYGAILQRESDETL